jgi:protocatechuate 3,4-dioxygenase beta subunit
MGRERRRMVYRHRSFWLYVAILVLGIPFVFGITGVRAAAQSVCTPTRPDAEGPFYQANAPERASTGQGLVISGAVRSASGCGPLPGSRLEWWSANPRGEYDLAHRAAQRADGDGRYRYETDSPGRYPGRPVHVHVRVTAPGHRALVTQLYPAPGQTTLAADFVLVHE